jgi:outer membrane protein assembly factor BamB
MGCTESSKNNWPQFRGINSLGIAPENAIPPLELNPDKNLSWKIPLARGLSSPCIFDGKIFLTGYNPKDSALITYCINQNKGSLLWERSVFPDTLEKVHQLLGSPATPTPVTDGRVVYVYFGAYGVLCYNNEGMLLWERRLPILNAQYGSNGSPIVYDSLLIINRVERKKPSILALNKINGETVWQQYLDLPSTEFFGPMDVSQSTPVIWRDQVIIHHGFELISLNLKDGGVKWKFGMVTTGNATPIIINDSLYVNGWYNVGNQSQFDSIPDFDMMIGKYDANRDKLITIQKEIPLELALFKRPEINLPLRGDTLYPLRWFAGGYDSNKDKSLEEKEWNQMKKDWLSYLLDHAVIALKLDPDGESDQPVLLWKEKDYVAEVPSLVVIGSRIYMVMNGGNLICIDSGTGSVIFNSRLGAPGSYLSSPLYANGHLYFASYNGRITIVKPGDNLDIVAHCDLREKISASPAALGKILYIRTDSALYAFKN